MGKKIAVISTAWNGEHIGGILNGMQQKIEETNNDMYIFNTYGGFEEEKEFNDCEYNIFNLALQSDFDGILILSNNIASYSRLEILMGQIKDRKIPCISIEQDVPDFHFIGTDNYTAMSEVVEHLIKVTERLLTAFPRKTVIPHPVQLHRNSMPNQNIPESFSPFHIFYVVMKSADKIQNTASVHCNKMFHHLRHGNRIYQDGGAVWV